MAISLKIGHEEIVSPPESEGSTKATHSCFSCPFLSFGFDNENRRPPRQTADRYIYVDAPGDCGLIIADFCLARLAYNLDYMSFVAHGHKTHHRSKSGDLKGQRHMAREESPKMPLLLQVQTPPPGSI